MSLLDNVIVGRPIKFSDDYHEDLKKYNFWSDSYAADASYAYGRDSRGNPNIERFSCEEQSDYEDRKKRVTVRSHITNVINKYNASVFANGVNRPFDNEIYKMFIQNVDGYGTTADDFFKSLLLEAQIFGESYYFIDTTATEENTVSAARASGVMPRLVKIPIENIIEEEDYNEKLTEILFLTETQDDGYVAIYFNATERAVIPVEKRGEDYIAKEYELVPHGYSSIPVAKCEPTLWTDSQVAPLAESLKKIINYLSLKDTEIYDSTFTRFIIGGIRQTGDQESGAGQPITWGARRILIVDDPAIKVERIGADVSQSDSIAKAIADEEQNLYRAAALSAPDPFKTGDAESGVAKIISRSDFEMIANALKQAIESAENYGCNLAMESVGVTDYVPVTYEDPEIVDESEDLQRLRDILSLNVPKIIKDKMIKRFADAYLELSDDEYKQLEQELNSQQQI